VVEHTNICSVHELGEHDGRTFLVMGFYEGETLRQKIDRGPLKIEEATAIACQVVQGMAKAHGHGIVHRDIEPANIMVTTDGVAKILDFGLAKLAGRTLLTRTGSTLGTAAYMSPEQARGESVDHRTDIWSLGVVLYEMIAGRRPFASDYEQALVYQILNAEPEPLSKVRPETTPGLAQIVGRAMEKDPEKRYQRFEEMLDDLKCITAGIVPDEIKARLMRARVAKKKRALLYAGAATVVIVAVLALLVSTRRSQAIESVAVLPIENLTGSAGTEYFVDGVTDELIGHISRIRGLRRVISRTSIMRYKNADKPVPEIARELGVDAVVEGTVYRVGDNVRLRLQLIDALPEERSLWSETYEGRPPTF
jgi:TolB-like protein